MQGAQEDNTFEFPRFRLDEEKANGSSGHGSLNKGRLRQPRGNSLALIGEATPSVDTSRTNAAPEHSIHVLNSLIISFC